jgi:hypothetical protein
MSTRHGFDLSGTHLPRQRFPRRGWPDRVFQMKTTCSKDEVRLILYERCLSGIKRMSRFNCQQVEVEFIYSSFVVSNTGHTFGSEPPPPSTFISGNRSGDYVSQTFYQGYSGRGFTESRLAFMFQMDVTKGYGLVS